MRNFASSPETLEIVAVALFYSRGEKVAQNERAFIDYYSTSDYIEKINKQFIVFHGRFDT